MAKNTAEKTKKKIGLSTQIFIALLIGALFGVDESITGFLPVISKIPSS